MKRKTKIRFWLAVRGFGLAAFILACIALMFW
jgi:hypothetical protein